MRIFSYRNKARLKRTALVVTTLAAALAIVCIAYVIYLGRYMVYTPDGAYLSLPGSDPSQELSDAVDSTVPSGELVIGDPIERPQETTDPSASEDAPVEATPVLSGGSYADNTALMQVSDVRTSLETLLSEREDADGVMTVLLDLKSEYGNFYYSSGISGASIASVDVDAIDSLIAMLAARSDVYLIARLPAFRDTAYALSSTSQALALSSGALWADTEGCYWLDPGSETVQDRLLAICADLGALGVDEVVFQDFCFPTSESIIYEGNRDQAVRDAASRLTEEAALPVSFSFTDSEPSYLAAAYGLHICLEVADGALITDALAPVSDALTGESSQIIFLSASRDTRFDEYIHLRPAIES